METVCIIVMVIFGIFTGVLTKQEYDKQKQKEADPKPVVRSLDASKNKKMN